MIWRRKTLGRYIAGRFTVARHVAEIEAVYELLCPECRPGDTHDDGSQRTRGR